LAALARETEELKNIKAAAGSPDYAKKVFDKVFNVDIHRLLSMESMWNNRAKPTPLSYEALEESLKESAKNEQHEVQGLPDQKIWDLSENFLVFKDR
jgi:ubiquitin-like 1-activating enzyme E1 B